MNVRLISNADTMKRVILTTLFLLVFICLGYSQSKDIGLAVSVKQKLDRIVLTDSNYAIRIDISVSSIPVVELLKNVGKAGELNVNANISPNQTVTCNFKQIRIADLLFFLCNEFALNLDMMGDVLTVYPHVAEVKEPEVYMLFDKQTGHFSFDFSGTKLKDVATKFSQASGCNLIVPQNLFNQRVSGYGNNMTLNEAVYTVAAVNSLRAKKKGEDTWMLFRAEGGIPESSSTFFSMDEVLVDSIGLITAKITGGNIQNIVEEVVRKLGLNYFLAANLSHTTNIFVESVELEDFLKVLFTGTNFTWKCENDIYIFGIMQPEHKLSTVKVVSMKYRTVEKVQELIPAEFKQGMEVFTFPDLNSLIISGEQRKVLQIIHFLKDIDKSVPLISIDVIIMDSQNSYDQNVGIEMGLGAQPTTTLGTLSPGIDMKLGANSVNSLISSMNGFGPLNLGKVTPNFYANLRLMEENGYVNLRSTPRLSTLNGNKATLKSGQTQHYKEVQTNIIGSQNPMQTEGYQWKVAEANFTLDITPYVSQDSCITLTIDLVQTDFTEQKLSTEDAPPGTTTRSFNSIIKVRNQEMVLLGGIESTQTQRSSKGLPFISRVPILRWLFGSTRKVNKFEKLNIFIKPTIIQ